MKLKFVAHMLMIDCGKASRKTRGFFTGGLTEGGSPPFNKYS